MIYLNIVGNGGDFIKSYTVNKPAKEIITAITCKSKAFIGETRNNYTHITLIDASNYYHLWLYNNTSSHSPYTTLIFGGISNSVDESSLKTINKDFGLIGRWYYSKRFYKQLASAGIVLTND